MPPLYENTGPELPQVLKKSVEVGECLGLVITVTGNMPHARAEALYDDLARFLRERCAHLFQHKQLGFTGIISQEFTIGYDEGYRVNVFAAVMNKPASPGGKRRTEVSQNLADLMKIIFVLVSDLGHSHMSPELLIALAPTLPGIEPSTEATVPRRPDPPSGQSGHGGRGPLL